MARYRIKSVGMRGHVHLFEDIRPLDNTAHVSLTQEFISSRSDAVNTFTTRNLSFRGDRYVTSTPVIGAVEVWAIVLGSWTKVATFVDPAGQTYGQFGASVAISGSFVAVGDPGYNNGAGRVYLYENRNGGWRPCSRPYVELYGESTAGFGTSMEMDGTLLVVGAPGASGGSGGSAKYGAVYSYLYDLQAKTWNDHAAAVSNSPQDGSGFGTSVSIDRELGLAVGSPYQNVNQGSTLTAAGNVQVFLRQGPTWSYQTTLVDPTANTQEYFGSSISYRADRLLVGAPGKTGGGGAVMFVGSFTTWKYATTFAVRATDTATLDANASSNDQQGACVDQDPTINTVYLSSFGSGGKIFVFELTQAGNWLPAVTPVLTASDSDPRYRFAAAISASNRGIMANSYQGQHGYNLYRFR